MTMHENPYPDDTLSNNLNDTYIKGGTMRHNNVGVKTRASRLIVKIIAKFDTGSLGLDGVSIDFLDAF